LGRKGKSRGTMKELTGGAEKTRQGKEGVQKKGGNSLKKKRGTAGAQGMASKSEARRKKIGMGGSTIWGTRKEKASKKKLAKRGKKSPRERDGKRSFGPKRKKRTVGGTTCTEKIKRS